MLQGAGAPEGEEVRIRRGLSKQGNELFKVITQEARLGHKGILSGSSPPIQFFLYLTQRSSEGSCDRDPYGLYFLTVNASHSTSHSKWCSVNISLTRFAFLYSFSTFKVCVGRYMQICSVWLTC